MSYIYNKAPSKLGNKRQEARESANSHRQNTEEEGRLLAQLKIHVEFHIVMRIMFEKARFDRAKMMRFYQFRPVWFLVITSMANNYKHRSPICKSRCDVMLFCLSIVRTRLNGSIGGGCRIFAYHFIKITAVTGMAESSAFDKHRPATS